MRDQKDYFLTTEGTRIFNTRNIFDGMIKEHAIYLRKKKKNYKTIALVLSFIFIDFLIYKVMSEIIPTDTLVWCFGLILALFLHGFMIMLIVTVREE